MKRFSVIFTVVLLTTALGARAAADVPDGVKTLLKKRCAVCHKGKFPPKGLNFEPANVAAVLDRPSREMPLLKIVDTKAPETSYILKKVRRESGIKGKPMPPPKALTAEELQVIETWVAGFKQPVVPDKSPGSTGGQGMIEQTTLEKTAPKRPTISPPSGGRGCSICRRRR